MANYTIKTLTIPSGYSESNGVLIPRNHTTVTIFTPDVLVVPAGPRTKYPETEPAWKLQISNVDTGDPSTDVWFDAYTFHPSKDFNIPVQLLFPYTARQALTFPASYLGVGAVRVSTFNATQTAASVWSILFGSFNN